MIIVIVFSLNTFYSVVFMSFSVLIIFLCTKETSFRECLYFILNTIYNYSNLNTVNTKQFFSIEMKREKTKLETRKMNKRNQNQIKRKMVYLIRERIFKIWKTHSHFKRFLTFTYSFSSLLIAECVQWNTISECPVSSISLYIYVININYRLTWYQNDY